MNIRINKAHFPVTALGPGRRIGIWLQGCTIGCVGCVSRDTWSTADGSSTTVSALVDWSFNVTPTGFDGVTISGGEPFQQPEALEALVEAFAAKRGTTANFDLLCYSGYPFKTLKRRFGSLLDRLDAVVSGPFIPNLAPGGPLFGSSNQELVPLSSLGFERYGETRWAGHSGASQPAMQVSVDEHGVWCIGIPRPGDLERLEVAARARGLKLEGASWRA